MSKKPKWEKCPVCNGTGKVDFNPKADTWPAHIVSTGPYTCPHCHGARIINRKTGMPPKRSANEKFIDALTHLDKREIVPPLTTTEGMQGYVDRFAVPDQEDKPKTQWGQRIIDTQEAMKAKYERKPEMSPNPYRKDPLEGLTPFTEVYCLEEAVLKDVCPHPIYNSGVNKNFIISQLRAMKVAVYQHHEDVKDITIFAYGYDKKIKEGQWVVFNRNGEARIDVYVMDHEEYIERFKP